ncbi:MAG: tetratricopeptide repeat protein [Beijerinckiaceae bacterium]
MPDISLRRVDAGGGEPRLNVIFVHGLGGDPVTTWCHRGGENDGYFWLKDIAKVIGGAAIYTLGYPGDKAAWNPGWPIAEAAVAVLDKLMNSRVLRSSPSAPIAFVCHSLGGLIIKKLVVTAHLDRGQQPAKGEFLDRIAGVVFLATPHHGSIVASVAKTAYWFVSKSLGDLMSSDAALLELGHFYRDRIANEEVMIRHRVYYETLGMWGAKVVTAASADPGLPGVGPIPVNRDHKNICKPVKNKDGLYDDDPVYEGIAAFLQVEVLQPRKQTQNQKLDEILALARHLARSSTSAPAAGRGAEQTVAAAVQSIAEGADAGDSLLEEALKLLRQNKPGEAVPLLAAFAKDKEAKIAADRKEAAIAYRNLGAIAGLGDPKRALEAYEKALALDPDDIESLYRAGAIQIDYGDLEKAQRRLERVLKLAETGDQALYKYAAGGSLGDVKQRRGDLSGALRSYRDTVPIIDRLAKADPGNAGWRRDLSVSYERIGGVQAAQGDLAGALKSYRDSLAIRDKVAKADPGNMEWQRDLSVSYNIIGGVQEAQGDLAGALKSYQDSLAIFDRLAKTDPGNAGWQRDLSVCWGMFGLVQEAQGDLTGALKSYEDSLAIRERLAKSDPGNAGWQRDLSVSYEKIGGVQQAQGDLAGALKSYSDSLAIRGKLAKADPGNAGWQRDLIVSYKNIADCSGPKERRAHLSRALEVAGALHASGRLAPADEWMLGALAKLIAEAEEK